MLVHSKKSGTEARHLGASELVGQADVRSSALPQPAGATNQPELLL